MTNSTPYKSDSVHVTPQNIKASGIDTLVISINGEWKHTEWFSHFADLKKQAQESSFDVPGTLTFNALDQGWTFRMKPNGSQGYEWLLIGNDFTLKIGKWAISKTRPSVIAEIHSEMLWHCGAEKACSYIITLISELGLEIDAVKPSRVDLCLDLLFPKHAWNKDLEDYVVSKGFDRGTFKHGPIKFKGISIGNGGNIMARLYDKGLEIQKASKKYWMFDIWGIDQIPQNKIMVRVEFQMRREFLKDIGIDTVEDLFEKKLSLWAYCTKDWLKFQDNIGKHRDQRTTMIWWKVVQNGYENSQGTSPAIREHILNVNLKQLARQAYGLILSFIACFCELNKMNAQKLTSKDMMNIFHEFLKSIGKTTSEMTEKVNERIAKFKRIQERETE